VANQHHLDPNEAFAELGRTKIEGNRSRRRSEQIADLDKRTIVGVDEASVALVRGKNAYTEAYTGALALTLDEWRYAEGSGICLDATTSGATLSVKDSLERPAGRATSPHAIEAGVRSSLSVGMPVQEAITGALNLYATKPDTFDEEAMLVAQTFSGYAAVALANAHLYDATATLAQHMQADGESGRDRAGQGHHRGRAALHRGRGLRHLEQAVAGHEPQGARGRMTLVAGAHRPRR
jgi:GAF domain-containing protein